MKMRMGLIAFWLLAPLAAFGWHFGPGKEQLSRDRASDVARAADMAAANEQWELADSLYGRALDLLPTSPSANASGGDVAGEEDRNRLRLAQAVARVQSGQMVEGQEQMQELLAEVESNSKIDPDLVACTRNELATASYYAAWLMRLEGATPEEWLPETERARQQFRLLAERTGEPTAEDFQKNLEATILLEQMDLSTLKARPLPKKCPSCCKNLSQHKRKQCLSRCNSEGKEKKEDEKDARKEIKKSISAGRYEMKGSGS